MHNQAIDVILLRLPEGVPLTELARVAGMSPAYLSHLKTGRKKNTQPATLGRLRLAVTRIRARQTEGAAAHNALFRSLLVMAALELQLDPVVVQNSDPSKRLTSDATWRNASFARWMARYLMNVTLGFSMADVGRAEGVTKAAVSASMPEIELRRDDPVFDEVLSRLELRLMGGA